MASEQFSAGDIQEGKMFAVLAYLSFCCIIPLILKKNNTFVLHHGKQALVLFVAQVALFILSVILPMWIVKPFVFITLIFAFWGMIQALRGLTVELPLAYSIAQRISL